MTTSNGKSAIESTEQSLPDYRQDSTEEMHEAFEREIISISTGYSPYAWIFFTAWNAAIATKQEELAQANATIASTKLTYQEKDLLEARIRGLELSNGLYINEIASKQEELAQAEEQIRKLKSELEDANAMNLLGTQQCIYTDVSNALKQANATIDTLQKESTRGTNLMLEVGRLANDEETLRLFSDVEKIKYRLAALQAKELALLAVIEQMKGFLITMRDKLIPDKPQVDHITIKDAYGKELVVWCKRVDEALALTPDMTALKEHDARVMEKAARCCEKFAEERFAENGTTEWDTGATYYTVKGGDEYETRDEEDTVCADAIRRMASELRQP